MYHSCCTFSDEQNISNGRDVIRTFHCRNRNLSDILECIIVEHLYFNRLITLDNEYFFIRDGDSGWIWKIVRQYGVLVMYRGAGIQELIWSDLKRI